ncbi:hypothetical protein Mal15_14020 [Stieleria maiorica]|uniref:Uncharacterized protein n=1 Tax=Stieleria maiorica TaxID=2795974 RepID=A0A5B9M889_9BACT|nr:hypothetical protein [Stieleria maiorica]QEF97362.1 hypothetical protein Mal15_14020 [Stieleria maiorica]
MTQSPDFDADPIRLLHIDFIGGPYDGHVETYHTRARLLPKELTWRVGADALRRLKDAGHDSNSDSHQSVTSVALYARETTGDTYRYRFVATISIKQLTDSIRDHED